MAWVRRQCRGRAEGNAIIITRQASGTAKIEPLMAAFNAIVDVDEPLVGATEHICGLDLAPYSDWAR